MKQIKILLLLKVLSILLIKIKKLWYWRNWIGFFYNNSKKDKQIKSFEEHIKASIESKMPLIIHSRNAEIETYDILNKYRGNDLKILMHCFTGSKKFAENLFEIKCLFFCQWYNYF